MLYRNLLTLFAVIGTSVIATAAHAQTRVHDILQERQNQAREYLSQDVESRGEFVRDRSESLRKQENSSIALSRHHDSTLRALDQAYEVERKKYTRLPEERRQNVHLAYDAYRATLIHYQREEMACTLMAIQNNQNASSCGKTTFNNREFVAELRRAADGGTVEAPQGSGTLQPRRTGIRIGNTDNSSGSSSGGGRVNRPTTPQPTTPNPPQGGSSGGTSGGILIDDPRHFQIQ